MWYFITVQTFHLALLQKILNRLTQSFQCVFFSASNCYFVQKWITIYLYEIFTMMKFSNRIFFICISTKKEAILKKITVINQTLKSYKDMYIIQETREEKKIPLDLWSLHSMIGSHHLGRVISLQPIATRHFLLIRLSVAYTHNFATRPLSNRKSIDASWLILWRWSG